MCPSLYLSIGNVNGRKLLNHKYLFTTIVYHIRLFDQFQATVFESIMGYGFQQWTKMLICPLADALSRLRVHGGTERVTTLI